MPISRSQTHFAGELARGAAFIILPALLASGCNPKVTMEGGDKPIHIVMDVNIKVDRQLDDFFSFENKPGTTQPSTQPTTAQAS